MSLLVRDVAGQISTARTWSARNEAAMRFLSALMVCLAFGLLAYARVAECAEYYVAPSGSSDSNNGSISSPFATFGKAVGLALAGDTIYARGGTYNLSSRFTIDKAGASNNPINLVAYPGESPILDFSGQSTGSSNQGVRLTDKANWWHIKGLTIQNAGDNGFYTEGDNGRFEQIVTRWNEDSGFQLHGTATNNLVLNCDSYENYDPLTVDSSGKPIPGENADGFAAKFDNLGPGNIIRGSRAWGNSDDGWDMWNSPNGVFVENSWSFNNGHNLWATSNFSGDGTGFKLGHDGGPHILAGVLAWGNAGHGIDINGNGYNYNGDTPTTPNGSKVLIVNSASYDNAKRNWLFDEDIAHVLRNNVSLEGGQNDSVFDEADDAFNTWNGIQVDEDDFLSLVDTIARGPRNLDGSLPISDFLKLASDSNLIDAGTPISFTFGGVTYNLAFNGTAPDLGAFETAAAGPALPGDYNSDNVVDAADYSVWRNNLDTFVELPNDETPGMVDESDYEVWKVHFGESLDGNGGLSGSAVPEPAGLILLLAAAGSALFLRRNRKY
jgi:Pel9A-like, right handed beta helix region